MSMPPSPTPPILPFLSFTVTSPMTSSEISMDPAPGLSSGPPTAIWRVSGVGVPQVCEGVSPFCGGFDFGGPHAAEPIVYGLNIPHGGLRAGRPGLSENNYSRVGMTDLPVKTDNVLKMKGSFDLYAVQLRMFLARMICWDVVDGTFAHMDPTLQISFVAKDNIAREAILSGVEADDAEMVCQEDTARAM